MKWIYIIIVLLGIGMVMVLSARPTTIQKINGDESRQILNNDPNTKILDVRTEEEYNEWHIPNSLLMPYDQISELIGKHIPDKETPIIVYCRSGNRSSTAANTLKQLGYLKIYDLGSYQNW